MGRGVARVGEANEKDYPYTPATHRVAGDLAEIRALWSGQAVKAASILTFLDEGTTQFSTGGAALNAAGIGANEALGYTVTERWRSYASRG